jgi:hypothetical protein
VGSLPSFAEGPKFAADLARVELDPDAQDDLLRMLQLLLLREEYTKLPVSHPLGSDTDIRYVRSREFPSLEMTPLYLTFRRESAVLIELRRIFTEADLRAGFFLELDS